MTGREASCVVASHRWQASVSKERSSARHISMSGDGGDARLETLSPTKAMLRPARQLRASCAVMRRKRHWLGSQKEVPARRFAMPRALVVYCLSRPGRRTLVWPAAQMSFGTARLASQVLAQHASFSGECAGRRRHVSLTDLTDLLSCKYKDSPAGLVFRLGADGVVLSIADLYHTVCLCMWRDGTWRTV